MSDDIPVRTCFGGLAICDESMEHLEDVETPYGVFPRYAAERMGLVRTWIDDLPEDEQRAMRTRMNEVSLEDERAILAGKPRPEEMR